MEANARRAIERFHMLTSGDTVVVGVSGGADSMALLHYLHAMRGEYGITLVACHVNHGIRADDAVRDERAVCDFCLARSIPCEVVRADVPALSKQRGMTLEECGRAVRYEAFERLAQARGAKIATAHTLSDSLETMLFFLARGTGLRGLCGIPPVRGRIIRPLIEATRGEVEAYCAANAIAYMTDSTNVSPDYTRNRIRLEVVPALMSVHPAGANAVRQTLDALRADEECLTSLAEHALAGCAREGGYDMAALRALPEALRVRALMAVLRGNGLAVRAGFLYGLTSMLKGETAGITLSPEVSARAERGVLRLRHDDRREPPPDYRVPLREGITPLYDGVSVQARIFEQQDSDCLKKIHPKLLKNTIDYDSIIGTAYFRPRREGDFIRLAGRGCTKTLKKLMNESKLSQERRARTVVLADEQGVIWVQGFGCAQRAAPTPTTARAATVTILNEQAR